MARGRTSLRGLKWARWSSAPTFSLEPATPTTSQAAGIRYEKRIAKKIADLYGDEAQVMHGPWIHYADMTGPHYAQPDIVIIPEAIHKPVIIIEVKLSHRPFAERKLRRLYLPLVKEAGGIPTGRRILLVQVFKSCRRRTKLPDDPVYLDALFDLPAHIDYCICQSLG